MRLRDGERWHFAEEKARLAACRAYDPELNDGVRQTAGGSLLPAGQGHAGVLPPRQGRGRPLAFPGCGPRHQFFTLCYPAAYLRFEGEQADPADGRQGTAQAVPQRPGHAGRGAALRLSGGGHQSGMPAGTITPPLSMKLHRSRATAGAGGRL